VLDGGSARRVLNLGEGSVVDGCIVQNGLATGDGGGGALMNGVSATIRNCVFQDCANSGGRGSALRIVNAANPTVVNSIFTGNRADGHVIDLDASGGLYAHLVVAYNVSNGLHFQLGSSPRIYNCVFAGNTNLGICHISANDQPMLRNNAFFANTAGLYFHVNQTYTTIAQVNALPFAADNLDADPAFADALARSFLLGPRSPLIDRGVDLPGIDRDLMLLPRRFDDPRFMGPGGTADVGAHEWSGSLLRPFGTPAPGNVVWLVIAAPNEPFRTFQMASSLGTGPIDLGGRKLALGFDPLLVLSVGGVLPEVFVGYPGILDGSGDSAAALVIPGSPALRGLVLHSAAVVQGPGGLGSISNTATITIQ
jgi:hypothetical protein